MLISLVFSFLITVSFAIVMNVPHRALLAGGFIGMGGYMLSTQLKVWSVANAPAVLLASFAVATVSQLLARRLKMPSTNFSIAGIIPLVPGAMAYRTMGKFIAEEYVQGIALLTETFLAAGAIAAGLMLSLSIFAYRKGMRGYGAQDITHDR